MQTLFSYRNLKSCIFQNFHIIIELMQLTSNFIAKLLQLHIFWKSPLESSQRKIILT